jgi:predicted phosphohydrolase
MKLHVLSDLHLEFSPLDLSGGDTLLLAGDICVAAYLKESRTERTAMKHKDACAQFFFEECAKYKKVYMIAGNHEHYSGVFDETIGILREYLKDSNVQVLDNETVDLGDWCLVGGTLWTDFNINDFFAKSKAKVGMNDFHLVKKKRENDDLTPFSPDDTVVEHELTLTKLQEVLYNRDLMYKPLIVMTHHCPTYQSIHPKYEGSILNYAYASDLSNLILTNPNIKYWIHGHTHDSFDYIVDQCRVIANPRGYGHLRNGYQNEEFEINFELEI